MYGFKNGFEAPEFGETSTGAGRRNWSAQTRRWGWEWECIDFALTSNDSISVEFFYACSRQRHNKVIFLFSFVFPQMNVKKGKWLYYKFFHNSILIIIIIWACITSVPCNIPDFVGGWLWLSLGESDCNSPGPNDKSDSSAQQNPLKNPPNCDCNRKDWRGAAADETEHP